MLKLLVLKPNNIFLSWLGRYKNMAIVKIKVFYGPEYARCKNISIDRNDLTQMAFISFSNKIMEVICQESSSMRIQYEDDEQTFVTMTSDEDFEDALRCVEPIQNYDDVYRLSIRVNDLLTPKLKSPAKKKQCIKGELSTSAESENTTTIRNSPNSRIKR